MQSCRTTILRISSTSQLTMSANGSLPPTAKFEPDTVFPTQTGPAANCESEPAPAATGSPVPERIGRFHIERLLGKGGFGLVYLGYDEQLERPVAVKVPHADRISRPEDAAEYL